MIDNQKKVVFLDRDGVINKEINYLHKIEDVIFIDGVFETCRTIIERNYEIIIVTNQSGISRKLYTYTDFKILTEWMLEKFYENGVKILDVKFCPHLPSDNCNCRKPKPGLILDAIEQYKINASESIMVGDTENDIIAAKLSNIKKTFLVRSGHEIDENTSSAKNIIESIADLRLHM